MKFSAYACKTGLLAYHGCKDTALSKARRIFGTLRQRNFGHRGHNLDSGEDAGAGIGLARMRREEDPRP